MPQVENTTIPSWLVKAIATTLITALISGGFVWASKLSDRTHKTTERVSVVETRQTATDRRLDDIQDSLKEVNKKLDRLIERRR